MRHIGGGETRRNVLVDANNLLYRAYFAFVKDRSDASRPEKNEARAPWEQVESYVRSLPSADDPAKRVEMDVGIVQGGLKILSSWLYDIQNPSRIVVFFDGLPSRRLALFPDYKKRDKDEAKQNVHIEGPGSSPAVRLRDGTLVHGPVSLLAHVFRLIGCDVYHHPGEEADDLIASFVRREPESVNVIMSSDKDFFQLVSDRTVVYRPGPNKPRIHDAERVEDCMEKLYKVRVGPGQIRMFKALTGDSSDGIVGIRGLRKKVAYPFCRLSTVSEVYESGLPGLSKGEREKALSSREQVELNYKLVSFYDELDLGPCLRPEIGDFAMASQILREDLSLTDVDLLPYRIGRHKIRTAFQVPDFLADV